MNYIASITSQGQVTIPKPLRDQFGVKGQAKAHLSKKGDKIELRIYTPHDLEYWYGALRDNPVVKANKGKPLQQIIEEETAAFHNAVANNVAEEMGLPPLPDEK
jgi:AbrB family looped-hinge helix DNA binding protein